VLKLSVQIPSEHDKGQERTTAHSFSEEGTWNGLAVLLNVHCLYGRLGCPRKAAIDLKRTLLSWSSGKDSAWSLRLLRQQNGSEVVGLLTTFNQEANRVAMHAARISAVQMRLLHFNF
jgi:hypothetical protein